MKEKMYDLYFWKAQNDVTMIEDFWEVGTFISNKYNTHTLEIGIWNGFVLLNDKDSCLGSLVIRYFS